ncbi:hypothetical protein MNV49_008013 (mitochondrion) [Pseudohyphozyma bogoriensis]|nr:hypothetical protein MNV49_008013 [Pseudohyphozyma bogoriensis]
MLRWSTIPRCFKRGFKWYIVQQQLPLPFLYFDFISIAAPPLEQAPDVRLVPTVLTRGTVAGHFVLLAQHPLLMLHNDIAFKMWRVISTSRVPIAGYNPCGSIWGVAQSHDVASHCGSLGSTTAALCIRVMGTSLSPTTQLYQLQTAKKIGTGIQAQRRLHGYLIRFAPYAFVSQRQHTTSHLPSPLVLLQGSKHISAPLGIEVTPMWLYLLVTRSDYTSRTFAQQGSSSPDHACAHCQGSRTAAPQRGTVAIFQSPLVTSGLSAKSTRHCLAWDSSDRWDGYTVTYNIESRPILNGSYKERMCPNRSGNTECFLVRHHQVMSQGERPEGKPWSEYGPNRNIVVGLGKEINRDTLCTSDAVWFSAKCIAVQRRSYVVAGTALVDMLSLTEPTRGVWKPYLGQLTSEWLQHLSGSSGASGAYEGQSLIVWRQLENSANWPRTLGNKGYLRFLADRCDSCPMSVDMGAGWWSRYRERVHIVSAVCHLDVDSAHPPGASAGKGSTVRRLKCYYERTAGCAPLVYLLLAAVQETDSGTAG